MAEQVALAAEPRSGRGKAQARSMRRTGRVPAVAYGAGLASTAISIDERQLYHALHTAAGENVVLRLAIDGDTHLAFAREIHRHPVRRDVLHLDFVAIDRRRRVAVDVPIHVEGEVEDGVISQNLMALHIEVLPLEVPASFTVDVAPLEIGDAIRAADVALPDGVDLLTDPDTVVVSIVVPTEEPEEEPTAEEIAAEEAAEGATAEEAGETAEQQTEDDEE